MRESCGFGKTEVRRNSYRLKCNTVLGPANNTQGIMHMPSHATTGLTVRCRDASTTVRFGHAKRAPLNLGVRPPAEEH